MRAKPEAAEEGAEAEARWSDIGSKIERDVRGWVASVVGTEKEADWPTIGNRMFDHARTAFDKAVNTAKEARHKDAPPEKIVIEGEDEPPVVKSSKPVDPEG